MFENYCSVWCNTDRKRRYSLFRKPIFRLCVTKDSEAIHQSESFIVNVDNSWTILSLDTFVICLVFVQIYILPLQVLSDAPMKDSVFVSWSKFVSATTLSMTKYIKKNGFETMKLQL